MVSSFERLGFGGLGHPWVPTNIPLLYLKVRVSIGSYLLLKGEGGGPGGQQLQRFPTCYFIAVVGFESFTCYDGSS